MKKKWRFSDVVCFRGDVTVMCQSDHAAVQLFEAKTSSGYRVFNTVGCVGSWMKGTRGGGNNCCPRSYGGSFPYIRNNIFLMPGVFYY